MAKVAAKAKGANDGANDKSNDGAKVHLQVAHRIESLLRTMRVIERHEEQLCVVMTEIRSAGSVSTAMSKELRLLLAELPGEAYQTDLDAVEEALVKVGTARGAMKTAAKRPAAKAKLRRA